MITPETPIRPEYEMPPLVEQAISIAFEPLIGFTIVDFGLFWREIAEAFPDVTTEQPLDNSLESFGEVQPSRFSFSLVEAPPMPRAMFRNGAGELIQMQVDRFGFNWAKEGGRDYPRSEAVMSRFRQLFAGFQNFVTRRGIGPITFTQCELTNLNVVPVSQFGSGYEDIDKAFVVDPLDLGLPFLKAETYIRRRQHRIVDSEGKPLGRLHTVISPVVSQGDNSKAYRLELTARSAPVVRSLDDAAAFFAIARNAINGAFQAITTRELKAKWREKHG
jgi:uncharacterized protein (TIGR04255 family)